MQRLTQAPEFLLRLSEKMVASLLCYLPPHDAATSIWPPGFVASEAGYCLGSRLAECRLLNTCRPLRRAECHVPRLAPVAPATKERDKFTTLLFFPVNYAAHVEARFVPDSLPLPFPMQTSTARRPLFRKYGELHFSQTDQPLCLTVYQRLNPLAETPPRDYLFVPFTDRANGCGSYGGGRYLDLSRKQVKRGSVLVNFNRAYIPCWAYSLLHSCLVPPAENRLPVAVQAG